jgi:hypothetical protein
MTHGRQSMILSAALLLCSTPLARAGTTSTVLGTAPTLTSTQSSAIVATFIARKHWNGCKATAEPTVKGAWAIQSVDCGPASINVVMRYQSGHWTYACDWGDDVMSADEAVRFCGLTHAQALALGFTDLK